MPMIAARFLGARRAPIDGSAGFRRYEQFRPEVRAGAEEWGAKGEVRIGRILAARV
jgi:hypothetical protein